MPQLRSDFNVSPARPRLLCHYCNYAEREAQSLSQMPERTYLFLGQGSERVEMKLHREFRERVIAPPRPRHRYPAGRQYELFFRGSASGVSTCWWDTDDRQKSRHPKRYFSGLISADIGLNMPDFRAAERTFQLLTQVADAPDAATCRTGARTDHQP